MLRFKAKWLHYCCIALALEINWSRGVEDGEAKVKNKNVRRKFEILKYSKEDPGVKKKDVAEAFTNSPKILSDVIKAKEKSIKAFVNRT